MALAQTFCNLIISTNGSWTPTPSSQKSFDFLNLFLDIIFYSSFSVFCTERFKSFPVVEIVFVLFIYQVLSTIFFKKQDTALTGFLSGQSIGPQT